MCVWFVLWFRVSPAQRVRVWCAWLQVDGQLRTGRDLAVAALLGAEEYGRALPRAL